MTFLFLKLLHKKYHLIFILLTQILFVISLGFTNDANAIENVNSFTKIGNKLGFSAGGVYRKNNEVFYLKFPSQMHPVNIAEDVAKNEVLASKIYKLSNLPVPDLFLIHDHGNHLGVASKIEQSFRSFTDVITTNHQNLDTLFDTNNLKSGMVIDAWLANWDVVGTAFDNIGTYINPTNGNQEAFRVDVGGALLFSGSGVAKNGSFGNTSDEWRLFRGTNGNYIHPMAGHNRTNILSAQFIFGKMSKYQVQQALNTISSIDHTELQTLINQHAPGTNAQKNDLFNKLIARKQFLIAKLNEELVNLDDPNYVQNQDSLEELRINQMLEVIKNGHSTAKTREIYKYITDEWLEKNYNDNDDVNHHEKQNKLSEDSAKHSLFTISNTNTVNNIINMVESRARSISFDIADTSYGQGVAAGEDFSLNGFWIKNSFSRTKYKSDNPSIATNQKYKLVQSSLSVGYDFGDDFIYGLAFSYTDSKIKASNDTKALDKISNYTITAYNLSSITKNIFASIASYYSFFDISKSNNTTKAKTKGNLFGAKIGLGYNYNISQFSIVPSTGLIYVNTQTGPYRERYKSTDKIYSSISQNKTQALFGVVQINAGYNYLLPKDYKLMPELHIGANRLLSSKNQLSKITFFDNTNNFSIAYERLPKTLYNFGSILKFSKSTYFNLSLGYEIKIAPNIQSHLFHTSVRVEF